MDRQDILNGGSFSLDEKSGVKFRLKYQNWNDNGYYTLYSLEMRLPDSLLSYKVADMRVMNINQKKGEKPSWIPTTPMVFIADVDSAETLFLMLTTEQRQRLEEIFIIRYDSRHVETEPVFCQSILRGSSLPEFIIAQKRIKELMHSAINIRALIDKHKTQLGQFISDING